MTHRQIIKEWLANKSFEGRNIIDWGSGSKPAFRYVGGDVANKWTTIDNAKGIPDDRKSNHINWDITKPLSIWYSSVECDVAFCLEVLEHVEHPEESSVECDVAFCLEVLEHVEYPEEVIKNIYNNLKSGGNLYLTAPFKYEVHAEADYWRFTEAGLKLLLKRNGFTINSIRTTTDELGYIVEAVKV